MSFNSDQLDAFMEIARLQSFSKAARYLSVSQPALSQRVQKLEESLRTTLIIRDPLGIKLTDAGHKLLRYCSLRQDLEKNILADISIEQPSSLLSGTVRVAGFSSVMRSVIIPSIDGLFHEGGNIRLEVLIREFSELSPLLRTAQTDFVVSQQPIPFENVESILLGHDGRFHSC